MSRYLIHRERVEQRSSLIWWWKLLTPGFAVNSLRTSASRAADFDQFVASLALFHPSFVDAKKCLPICGKRLVLLSHRRRERNKIHTNRSHTALHNGIPRRRGGGTW